MSGRVFLVQIEAVYGLICAIKSQGAQSRCHMATSASVLEDDYLHRFWVNAVCGELMPNTMYPYAPIAEYVLYVS